MPWPHVLKYYLLLQNPAISPMNSVMLLSVQFSHSVVSDFVTPWTAACQASLSITNSWSLLKLMSIESVMPSNHLILCCPLLLLPPSFSASGPFPMSLLITSGGWSIGASASTSVLAMNHFSSVVQSCPTVCDPMDCSMPGFSVHHQLPEIAQTHVHWGSEFF